MCWKDFPVQKLRTYGYELNIIVVDNNCTDDTAELAAALGARVIQEPKRGKGFAMRRGFYAVPKDSDYVVMLDGDATYQSQEIVRMLEPLSSGFASVVVGSRLGGRIREGSMRGFNRLGNWVYSHLVRFFYRVNVTDVLTGYFAWERAALERLRPHLRSSGFAIEMEMVTKMAKLGEQICSVPISYFPRKGNSSLRPIYDGIRILWMFAKNLFWRPGAVQRIAFVSDGVMPYFQGGKERRLYEISRRLVKEGREVHVYTMQWWQGPKSIMHEGVIYHALCPLYPMYHGERRSVLQAVLFGLSTFKLLFVPFDMLDVDHMPYFPIFSARIVTWLRGKSLFVTWHEVWGKEYWREYLGPLGYVGYLIERISYKLPDLIISNSLHTTRRLIDAGVRKDIRTVLLGVDLNTIYTAPLSLERSDVIFIGRLIDHKNPDLLVQAIALVKKSLPDVQCTIVGDGPARSRVAGLIEVLDLKQNIVLRGSIESSTELYSLMKASKMLVLPSEREGFGLVAVEANAAGLPVITTSHHDNAAKDLICNGVNGYVVEPNAVSIAEKIVEGLRSWDTFTPRRDIERYDWRAVTESIEEALV